MTARAIYDQGADVRSVATALGVSVSVAHKRLRDEGYAPRKSGRKPLKESSPEDIETATALRRSGLTFREIAAEMKIAVGWAHRLVKEGGL